jgi:hypothetical protein
MRATGKNVCRSTRFVVTCKTPKNLSLVELTKKNRHAFWDANIPQAAIHVKRIQVMLERVRHVWQPQIVSPHAHLD